MSEVPGKRHAAMFISNLQGGGIQRMTLNLAEGLLGHGVRVDLVLVQANGPLSSEIPVGCRVFNLDAGHASRSLFKLVRYLKNEKPGVLVSSQTHLNVVAVMARLFYIRKIRLILREHVTIESVAQNALSFPDKVLPMLASLFYRLADEIILVSKDTADHFQKATHIPEKKIKVIYNPVVSRKIAEQSLVPPGHAWFSRPNTIVILAAGRLTAQKDFATLLRAFSLVRTDQPSVKLIILGEGEDRSRLERLSRELNIEEDIQLPGYVLNPFTYMANADLFVLSSKWEGFANVLVEAMACGTPVVSTDCPSGPSEILQNGKYGRLVPVNNPSALAEAIKTELTSAQDRDMLVQQASKFSVENSLNQYLQVFFPDGDNSA
jgi:glycosyltransferase involved in cell wall biosynthesis